MARVSAPTRGDATAGPFVALRYRDYALFWTAAIISNSGSWMQTITVPYVIFVLTRSTTWVGVTAFAAFVPALLVVPFAGSVADRFPRKRVVFITQTVMMLAAFGLWGLWTSGAATPGLLLALLFVSALAGGVNIASWQSLVPQLVPPEHMLNAIRLNSMQFTAARAFGPALAGFVLGQFGAGTAFLFNAVTFLLVLAALIAIHPRPINLPEPPPVLEHLRAGIAYVRKSVALVLPVVAIGVLSFFGSSVVQLSAPIARDVFDVGKQEYGYLVAAFGAGAVVGSLVTLTYGDRIRRSRMAMVGLAGFAIGEIVLGSAPSYGVGLGGLFIMGLMYVLVAVSLNTSIQARVDESHRGRVMSIYLMGLFAGVPFGALAGGAIADGVGLRATIIAGASVLAVFAAIAATKFAALRPLDENLEPEVHADALLTSQPAVAGVD